MFGLKCAPSKQLRGDSPLKQQPLSGHLYQDEANQLPHVHPTDHLLKTAGNVMKDEMGQIWVTFYYIK